MKESSWGSSRGFPTTTIKKGAMLKSDLLKVGTYRATVTIGGYSTAVIEDVIVHRW